MPASLRRRLPGFMADALRRWLWSLPNLRRTLPSGLRIEVRCPADWAIYNDIFVDREYEPAIAALLARAVHGVPVEIVDLGANVGYFSLYLADRLLRDAPERAFRLTLVEGSARLVRELERRLAQPRLAPHLHILHGLVGQRTGHGRLLEMGSLFEYTASDDARHGGAEVAYLDLAQRIPPGRAVHLVKCDIEGAEEDFVEAYADWLAGVELLAIELHPRRCDARRCLELLAQCGLDRPRLLREVAGNALYLLERA
jgi:FkbM family methyltransferase